MKKERLFILLIAFLIISSGCMSEMKKQKITIQKRIGEENIFEDYKEVTQSIQVRNAIEIMKNADWENAKEEMILRSPKYAGSYSYQLFHPFFNIFFVK
jgi:hypothetical protein